MIVIPESFESIRKIMQKCIEKEMTPDGLLRDVETFIPITYHDSIVDEPVIWMTQHPSRAERQPDITQTMDLITPFEFDCAVYAPELEDAENESQNLALRTALAVTKNFLHVQKELFNKRIIKTIALETYYPIGEVQINGKSDRLPATGIVLNVMHPVNWVICCKKILKEE